MLPKTAFKYDERWICRAHDREVLETATGAPEGWGGGGLPGLQPHLTEAKFKKYIL
jgi:hypothetical protein